jgi:two-component system sensor histidine kinase UhpB
MHTAFDSRGGGLDQDAAGSRWDSHSDAVHRGSPGDGSQTRPAGYRRLSLYSRVLLVNAAVLTAATFGFAFTPARIPFPAGVEEAVLLLGGLAVMVVANAMLLRVTFAPLSRLVQLMLTIDLLRPGQRLAVTGGIEVRAVISGFNEMLNRLEDERRQSSRRALSTQEEERRRIGRELHDEIGQRLTGILLELKRAATAAPAELRPGLLEVQEEVRSTLDEVGRVAWRLRPGILDDLGLVRALEALATTVEEHGDVKVVRRLDARAPRLLPATELAVYRIAQESLTNAIRHANAARIELALERLPSRLRLSVADDGNGTVVDEMHGSGIRGMRERALFVGGDLDIVAAPGRGVSVLLDIPLDEVGA